MSAFAKMFRDTWDNQNEMAADKRDGQKQALAAIKTKISKLTDRLIETDNLSAIQAYERKLLVLEAEKALIEEKLANQPTSASTSIRNSEPPKPLVLSRC